MHQYPGSRIKFKRSRTTAADRTYRSWNEFRQERAPYEEVEIPQRNPYPLAPAFVFAGAILLTIGAWAFGRFRKGPIPKEPQKFQQ